MLAHGWCIASSFLTQQACVTATPAPLCVFAVQAASTVRHLMLPAHWTQRVSLVTDLVACYGLGGRSIVFTETKNDANELAGSLSDVVGARWVAHLSAHCPFVNAPWCRTCRHVMSRATGQEQ
jgi:hypothetical protein